MTSFSSEPNNTNPNILNKSFNSKISYLLEIIWPIHRHEASKFLSIAALMFCILFIQNVIRATKDSLVNTMIGVESVSFLKFWGVMPASILFAMLYVKLVSRFRPEKLFYIIIGTFIVFFAIFGFVIFPYHEFLHLDPAYANALIERYPNLKWFILLFSNWGFSLFYIIAELWPNAAFSLLFWQFVNSITSVDESKRFYTLFGLLGQTGLIISGSLLKQQKDIGLYLFENYGISSSAKIASLEFIMAIVVVLGILALYIFRKINTVILPESISGSVEFKAKKAKMTIAESFKMALESRYIRLIAIMLICYGVSINLVEGPWKAKAAKMYTSSENYLVFTGEYLWFTGVVTLLFVLLGSNIVRRLGWYAAAIITPAMLFVTGLMFFSVANFEIAPVLAFCSWVGTDPVMLAIILGSLQNVLTKSSKYTLFDSTKEMSYVPLDDELKTRGKAAVDVIGVKLGKSLSGLIQSLVFIIIPNATLESISPYLMVVFAVICLIWVWAVKELSKEYEALTAFRNRL